MLGKGLRQVINSISGERRWQTRARKISLRKAWKTQPARGEKAAEQTTRIGQAAADQTARVGQAAAEAGEEVAREGADLLKQNVDTLQNTWRSGLETATSVMGRSSEQFGRTLGLSGEEAQKATEATERSARTAQTLLYSGNAAARVMGGMSQEYLQMVRHQIENNISHLNRVLDLPNSSGLCSRYKVTWCGRRWKPLWKAAVG